MNDRHDNLYVIGNDKLTEHIVESLITHKIPFYRITSEENYLESKSEYEKIIPFNKLNKKISSTSTPLIIEASLNETALKIITPPSRTKILKLITSIEKPHKTKTSIPLSIAKNEKQHSYYWVKLKPKSMTASILAEEKVDISAQDTANDIIKKIILQSSAQLPKLLKQSNINEKEKLKLLPRAPQEIEILGIIDWTKDAKTLIKLKQSLEFKEIDNPYSDFLFKLHHSFFKILKAKDTEIKSRLSPGGIEAIEGSTFTVSTSTTSIVIESIQTLALEIYSGDSFCLKHNLKVGDHLPLLSQYEKEKLLETMNTYNEFDLIKKLISSNPIRGPYYSKQLSNDLQNHLAESTTVSNNFHTSHKLITAFIIYLYKSNQQNNISLRLLSEKRKNDQSANLFIENFDILNIALHKNSSIKNLEHETSQYLLSYKNSKPRARKDLSLRYPSLKEKRNIVNDHSIATVALTPDIESYKPNKEASLTLAIEQKTKRFCIFYSSNILNSTETQFILKQIDWKIKKILEVASKDPSTLIYNLNTMTPDETFFFDRHKSKNMIINKLTHPIHLISSYADKHPNKIAIETTKERISYRTLTKNISKIASHLAQQGIKEGDVVGVYLNKEPNLIYSILAIISLGAIYNPLDPQYPDERIKYIIKDSKTKFIIQRQTESIKYQTVTPIIKIDITKIDSSPTQYNIPWKAIPTNPCYVIYTSGSTGSPKGALISHKSLSNLVFNQLKLLQLNENDKVLAFAPISFDASIWEIFSTFSAGATLVLPPSGSPKIGKKLGQLIEHHNVSFATLPPTIISTLNPDDCASLRTLISAGERCRQKHITLWGKRLSFINAYGPTEATVCSTISKPLKPGTRRNIGAPLINTRIFILDSNLEPVSIGDIGEIFISGENLAIGYLHNKRLTNLSFLNISINNKKVRAYKTGDLARWLPNGTLQYINRKDIQAKIRGFRIEPIEIEKQILLFPKITKCAVIVKFRGTKRYLASYLEVSGLKTDFETSELRKFLLERLPSHMIPSVFVILDKLPLTPNLKVNRKLLSDELNTPHNML